MLKAWQEPPKKARSVAFSSKVFIDWETRMKRRSSLPQRRPKTAPETATDASIRLCSDDQ